MSKMSRTELFFKAIAALGLALFVGCTEKPQTGATRYPTLAPRDVPDYLQDTILQYTDLSGNAPAPVSGYGLVTQLHGTGGSRVATPVRAAILKELARHNFGMAGGDLPTPEQFLASRDVAIVRIDGYVPVGARSALDHGPDLNGLEWEAAHAPAGARSMYGGDHVNPADWCTWFDVRVSIPPESDATSLAHGVLYQSDLKVGGANPNDPGNGRVTVEAQAAGEIFVNPSYAADSGNDTSNAAQFSLKSGVIFAGARVLQDRPLMLRLRAPSMRASRAIENRINERFADEVDNDLRGAGGNEAATEHKIANAGADDRGDEGLLYIYVPKSFAGNWEHFAGIVRHLYMRGGDPVWAAEHARKLALAAVLPKAPLLDISYCWEGLGKPALHAIQPLMSNQDEDVQFAAARAALFIGDPAAVPVLLQIASTPGNKFRVTAVKTLAEMPPIPRVDRLCRTLLDSDEAHVREEAYELLVKHHDTSVYTRWIMNGTREKFALDLIPSGGKPLVYATRQGVPRIAVFGRNLEVGLPLIFTAMNQKLSISAEPGENNVTIFYRGDEVRKPITTYSRPSLPELVARLAGDNAAGVTGLRFGYADIVGILQEMIDQKRVTGSLDDGRLLASFVLQEPPVGLDQVDTRVLLRPSNNNGARPQSDRPAANDSLPGDHLLRPNVSGPGAMGPAVEPARPTN